MYSQAQELLPPPDFKINAVLKADYKGFNEGSQVFVNGINSTSLTNNSNDNYSKRGPIHQDGVHRHVFRAMQASVFPENNLSIQNIKCLNITRRKVIVHLFARS